jgi:hypothetical protein
LTQQSWDGPCSSKSGLFGALTSQMYEERAMPSGCCWNPRMLYAMAHFRFSTSGFHEM